MLNKIFITNGNLAQHFRKYGQTTSSFRLQKRHFNPINSKSFMFYRINKRPIYAKFSALCDKSFSICCYLQFRVPRFGFQILTCVSLSAVPHYSTGYLRLCASVHISDCRFLAFLCLYNRTTGLNIINIYSALECRYSIRLTSGVMPKLMIQLMSI